MSFAIVADFPLGTYRGHVGEGELEPWPSSARLHAALLSAAGQGTRATESGGVLTPDGRVLSALSWLEENPPDGLALPLSHLNHTSSAAFRDMGQLKPGMRGIKRAHKTDADCVALGASVMWIWESDPPRSVRGTLDELCPDVPYLGQADSPVRLRVESTAVRATHRRDREARLTTSRRSDVEHMVARRGRAAALVAAHSSQAGTPPPSPAKDRAKTDESDRRRPVTIDGLGRERYSHVGAVVTTRSPWTALWVLPIVDGGRARIGLPERVAWAVALHRALIAVHGDGAPGLLTGHYADDVPKPANRVAVQVIDSHAAMAHQPTTAQAFVVALPSGVDPAEVEAVNRAVTAIREVRRPGGGSVRVDLGADRPPALENAATYWTAPKPGMVRCWATTPAVPDVRPPKGGSWSLADAVTLSVALTWRDVVMTDDLSMLGRDERWRAMAEAVRDHGVEVFDVRRLSTNNADRYVHRVSSGLVVQPYVAVLHLGDLVPDGRVWSAIGQSRHLGGGQLLPLDASEPTLEAWRHE